MPSDRTVATAVIWPQRYRLPAAYALFLLARQILCPIYRALWNGEASRTAPPERQEVTRLVNRRNRAALVQQNPTCTTRAIGFDRFPKLSA
jgi:hypothetical protein